MENIKFLLINQYRAWQWSDSVLFQSSDIEKFARKALKEELKNRQIIMFDGPSPAIYVCIGKRIIGQITNISLNRTNLIKDMNTILTENKENEGLNVPLVRQREEKRLKKERLKNLDNSQQEMIVVAECRDSHQLAQAVSAMSIKGMSSGHPIFATYHGDGGYIKDTIDRFVGKYLDTDENGI